jgi:uncharacterized RDD family membrane protein YckC
MTQDPNTQGTGPSEPDDATAPIPAPGDVVTPEPPAIPPQEPMPGYPASSYGDPAAPGGPATPPAEPLPPDAVPPPYDPPPPYGAAAPGVQPPYGTQPPYGAQPPYGTTPGYGAPPPGAPAMSWAPPEQVMPAGPGVAGLVYASTLARFVAYVIDSILLGIVTSIATAPFAASMVSGLDFRRGNIAVSPIALIITVGASALYFIGFWSSGWRGTPGMKLLRLQVGDAATGRTLTPEQSVRRWIGFGTFAQLLGFIPALGVVASTGVFLWTLVLLVTTAMSPTKQGLHDRFASTAVVQPYGGGNSAVIIGCLLIIALIVLASFVGLIFLGAQMSTILSEVGTSVQG